MATKKKNGKKKKAARAKPKINVKTRKAARRKTISLKRRSRPGAGESDRVTPLRRLRTPAAGQSGDTQGLSELEDAGPESVDELLEEGQAFEAEAISGVENARRPDKSAVKTREVPEDDVPTEYDDIDQ